MRIWYETNVDAHSFIPEEYWSNNYDAVKAVLPSADVLIYEEEAVKGFIGITDNYYIAGLFVAKQFQGCGIGGLLLDECKRRYSRLELDVYVKNVKSVAFYKKHGFVIKQDKVNTHFSLTRRITLNYNEISCPVFFVKPVKIEFQQHFQIKYLSTVKNFV